MILQYFISKISNNVLSNKGEITMRKGGKGFIKGLIPRALLVSNGMLPREVMFVSGDLLKKCDTAWQSYQWQNLAIAKDWK